VLLIILAPIIIFAAFCLSAAAYAVLVGWLADFGIYFTEMCPSPETIARREAEAEAERVASAARDRKMWAGIYRERVQRAEEQFRQAIGCEARDVAEHNLCSEMASEQYHLDGWAGKVTLKDEPNAPVKEIDRRCKALLNERRASRKSEPRSIKRPDPIFQRELYEQLRQDFHDYDKISFAFCSEVDGHHEYGIKLYMERTGASLAEAQDMLAKVNAEVKQTGSIGFI